MDFTKDELTHIQALIYIRLRGHMSHDLRAQLEALDDKVTRLLIEARRRDNVVPFPV